MNGNVVLIVPYGTWSLRCTNKYIEDVSSLVGAARSNEFAALVAFDDWQLATPDAIELLKNFNEKAARDHGMNAECFVGKTTATPLKIAEMQIAYNYESLCVVDSVKAATCCLVNKGYQFDNALFETAYSERQALLET